MPCYFKKDGTVFAQGENPEQIHPDLLLKGDSFADVRQMILQELGHRNSLNFYNAGLEERLTQTLSELKKNYEKSDRRNSQIASHSVLSLVKTQSKDMKEAQDPVQKFVTNFTLGPNEDNGMGHRVHAYMEQAVGSTSEMAALNDIAEFLKQQKVLAEKLNVEHADLVYAHQKGDLISFIKNASSPGTIFADSIKSVKEDVARVYARYKPLYELPIAAKNADGHWVRGKIDALYYNEQDNEIIIVDYKTSLSLSKQSSVRDKQYYLQLAVYRRILQSMGFTDVDIKIQNVYITYNSDGTVSFDKASGIVDMDANFKSGKDVQQAQARLDSLFPSAFSKLISLDQKKAIATAHKQYDVLFDTKYLQRLKPKYLKDELEKRFSRNQGIFSYTFEGEGGTLLIEKVGDDLWTLYSIDKNGKRVDKYVEQTSEQISKVEAEHAIAALKHVVRQIASYIKGNKIEALKDLISKDREKAEKLYQNLSKYFNNKTWFYQKYEQLEALGIMCFQNIDGTLDFVILNDFSIGFENLIDQSGNLISGVEGAKAFDGIPQKTYGNMLKLRGLLAISPVIQAISKETQAKVKIGSISALSTHTGEKNIAPIDSFLKCLQEIEKADKDNFGGVYSGLVKSATFTPQTELYYKELSESVFAKSATNRVKGIFDNFDHVNIHTKISKLRELQRAIKQDNPKDIPDDPTKIDLSTDAGKIYAMASKLILKLQGFDSEGVERVTRYSVTTADTLSSLLSVLGSGQIMDYTDHGQKITGIFGGMDFATAYNSPSKFVDWGNQRMLAFQHTISKDFIDSIDESNSAAIEFIEAQTSLGVIKGGQVIDSFLGAHRNAYLRLLQQKKGQYLPICKNPFTDSSLGAPERKYLKQFLWNINKYRMSNSAFPLKYKALSFEQMEKDQAARKFFEGKLHGDREWLYLPLMPSSRVRGFIQNVADYKSGKKTGRQVLQAWGERIQRFASPNDLSVAQLDKQEGSMQRLENYNIYRDSEASRAALLEKYESINNFELNFNFLQNDLQLKYITEQFNTHLLNEIRDLVVVMQLAKLTSNIDLSDQIATVLDRTKIMLYGNNRVPNEVKEATGAIGTLKSALSLAKIGFRLSSMVKEGVVGRLKNWSMTVADLFITPSGKKLPYKTLMKASTEVWPDGLISGKLGAFVGHHKLGQFTKVEAISDYYQISDKDMHTISESKSADREGLLNAGLRTAYYTAVRLDWYNRNQLFIGCMMEDGCYDAHSYDQKTGKLVYDMNKDSRFSEFWKHRNDSNYTSETFEYQKALYLIMVEQFNKDNPFKKLRFGETIGEDGKPIEPVYDPLPAAYTSKQLMAIKEQIGMLYGFYDHQEKTNFENGTWWQVMTSMLTYLPGEVHKYFMKKGQNSIGSYQHIRNAEGQLLYYDENGNVTTEKKNQTGRFNRPVLEWTGDQVQGLAISTLSVLGKLLRGSFYAIKDQDLSVIKSITSYEFKSSLVCLFNILWGVLFAKLIIALWKLIFGDEEPTGELKTAYEWNLDLARRVGNDMSFYFSLVQPIDDFGIVGIDFVKQTTGDVIDLIGDGSPKKVEALMENISFLKDMHFNFEED